jgi:hypothetical protein
MKNCRGPVIANGYAVCADIPYRMPGGRTPGGRMVSYEEHPSIADTWEYTKRVIRLSPAAGSDVSICRRKFFRVSAA